MNKKPKIGETVLYYAGNNREVTRWANSEENVSLVHPAIVTRVFEDGRINLTVIPDKGGDITPCRGVEQLNPTEFDRENPPEINVWCFPKDSPFD